MEAPKLALPVETRLRLPVSPRFKRVTKIVLLRASFRESAFSCSLLVICENIFANAQFPEKKKKNICRVYVGIFCIAVFFCCD